MAGFKGRDHLREKARRLGGLGVNFGRSFSLGAKAKRFDNLLSVEAQLDVADLLGRQVGYRHIEVEPDLYTNGRDVDVRADIGQTLNVQVKSRVAFTPTSAI